MNEVILFFSLQFNSELFKVFSQFLELFKLYFMLYALYYGAPYTGCPRTSAPTRFSLTGDHGKIKFGMLDVVHQKFLEKIVLS